VIRLSLPWPPTVNTYWRHARGRHYVAERGLRYRELVAWTVRQQHVAPQAGALGVVMRCYPPDRRVRDIDNLPKGLLDALTHARVWEDDNQVAALVVTREARVTGGRVDVTICAATETVDAYAAGRA
jgi:crossover junction endodeoxyribonuclease RusA